MSKPVYGNIPVMIGEEQIEEAMISAFMKQYAAALDAGVDAAIEECADDEFPPELDARCRALIEQAGGSTHSGEAERAWQSFVQNYLPESPEECREEFFKTVGMEVYCDEPSRVVPDEEMPEFDGKTWAEVRQEIATAATLPGPIWDEDTERYI